MAADDPGSKADKQDQRLDEAFTRLEEQDMSEPKKDGQPGQSSSTSAATAGAGRNSSRDVAAAARPAGGVSGALAMLLALVAIGMASYPLYLMVETGMIGQAPAPVPDAAVEALRQSQASRLAGLEQQLQALADQVAGQQSAAVVTPAALEEKLQLVREELGAQVGTSSQDWLMAEVEYLLRLANQRVLMERDTQGAAALLEAADAIVRDAKGIIALDLRAAIASDLAELAAVPSVDTDGLYLRLAALVRQVDQLSQKPQGYVPPPTVSSPLPTAEQQTISQRFLGYLADVGNRLATLVDYRRDGVAITPVLPPAEEYYLRQNLVLKLQIAELALLRGDQLVYAEALADASRWTNTYFDPQAPKTRSMQAAVDALAKTQIAQQMPDISASLALARQMMAKFGAQPRRGAAGPGQPPQQLSVEPPITTGVPQ